MSFVVNAILAFSISAIFAISMDFVISEIYGANNTNISSNSLPQINLLDEASLATLMNNSDSSNLSQDLNNASNSQWTGSIKIDGEMDQSSLGKIKVDMCQAGFTSEKAVGVNVDSMQSKTSVKLTVENGYLVYRAGVVDGNESYTVIVDPADGRILNIKPMVEISEMGMSTMYKCMDMSQNNMGSNGTGMMMH